MTFTNTANLLSEDLSLPSLAMGGAVTGKADDISMVGRNPAAINSNHFMSLYMLQKIEYSSSGVTSLAYGYNQWGFSLGVLATLSSPVNITEVNDMGQTLGSGTASELVAGLIAGKKFETKKLNILSGFYEAGVTAKVYHSQIFNYTTTVPALDIGLVHRKKIDTISFLPNQKEYNISFGYSMLNLGPSLKYSDSEEALPLNTRFGIEYAIFAIKNHEVALTSDVSYLKGYGSFFGTGAEYIFSNLMYLRAGYEFGNPVRSLSAGLGIKYSNFKIWDFNFQYAIGLRRDVSSEHFFGMVIRYNRGLLEESLKKVEIENKGLDEKIDSEILTVLRKCIKSFEGKHENFPDNLKAVEPCVAEYGFSSLPQPLSGDYFYDPISGEIKIVPAKVIEDKHKDRLFLIDGSVLKGFVQLNSDADVILTSATGRVIVKRNLIKYARLAEIPQEDQEMLKELTDIVKNVKVSTGSYPLDLKDLGEYFKLQKGVALPTQPSRGKYSYNADNGEIMIVDNYK